MKVKKLCNPHLSDEEQWDILINAEPIDFTPDWLRTFDGFENYSDEEAVDFIENMKHLSNIVVRHVLQEQKDKKQQ